MTKKKLQVELTKLNIAGWNAKTPKAKLESLLKGAIDDATVVKDETKASAPPATVKASPKRVSAKEIIRSMFPKKGDSHTKDEVYGALSHLAKSSISTTIGDLRSTKYCGAAGPIDIQTEDANFVRH